MKYSQTSISHRLYIKFFNYGKRIYGWNMPTLQLDLQWAFHKCLLKGEKYQEFCPQKYRMLERYCE